MRNIRALGWLLLSIALAVSAGAEAPPSIRDYRLLKLGAVTADVSKAPLYGKIEFSFNLEGFYENAFDPDQIDVNAHMRGPDGKTIAIPGFYYQDYARALVDGREVLTPKGDAGWRVRFSPARLGQYSVTITARDRTGEQVESKPTLFECIGSDNPGFIRRSLSDNRYFVFDNGQPYVPIGANVCWASQRATFDYDDWLRRYGEAGCSYFRVWLGPDWTTFALEHTGDPHYYGLGKFDLARAWRLDYVLDLAAQNGLYAMLCLDSFNELRKESDANYPHWEKTPHSVANGGPLREPREFWTDPKMLRLYRNKLRYLVARYAWNTHVMSWEFWNEVDCISPTAYALNEMARWHEQMSDYLRGIDPWKHLQTTSFGNSAGEPDVDGLKQLDYTQTHNYGSPDMARALVDFEKRRDIYGKPHYVGEFGTGEAGAAGVLDPHGIMLHSGLWSTICSGSAGPAMMWYWYDYIHPRNLYYHFAAISNYVKGIDFPREDFKRIEDAEFVFAGQPADSPYQDAALTGPTSWKPSTANRPTSVTVGREGTLSIRGEIAGILHGLSNHPTLHNPLTFELALPHPTNLRIRVSGVSGYGGAHLTADLDGKRALDKDMPDTNTQGKHDTLRQYDGEYAVAVPEGAHVLKVENIGVDWMLLSYALDRAERASARDLELFGMRGKNSSLLWIRNSRHTWYNVNALKREPDPLPPTKLRIASWPSGKYKVSLWDTYKGEVTDSWTISVRAQGLALDLPAFQKDIALKVKRL